MNERTGQIPTFAIVGHPNEGKSAVVSTLSEDDSVVVSPTPGETRVCSLFPVVIDGKEIIRFVDTPGFQNPTSTLEWFKHYHGPEERMLSTFCKTHRRQSDFRDDCELLGPIAQGAGIIYVVDGSRPLRRIDKAEMEVLRLTGRPRMAIINSKTDSSDYSEEWKSAFRKSFNAIRVFNAHKATYAERVALLESLKGIDQDWQGPLEQVISAFKTDWQRRNRETCQTICSFLEKTLAHQVTRKDHDGNQVQKIKAELEETYKQEIAKFEIATRQEIKKLFKHNIFNLDLPAQSIVNQDLFNDITWRVLGLKTWQLAVAGATTGAAIGAGLDLAAAGLSFGIFAATGALTGVGTALWGSQRVAEGKSSPIKIGSLHYTVGPNQNVQFMYVLLDRILIFYAHTINWAHGRREVPPSVRLSAQTSSKGGYTATWDRRRKDICNAFFHAQHKQDTAQIAAHRRQLADMLMSVLDDISNSMGQPVYGLYFSQGG